VDRERDWLLSRLQRRRDNAPARAFDEFYANLYGAHPYALPNLGTRESLARIDHAAIVDWYRRFYRPERMTLVVSGQVGASEVMAEARRLFGGLAAGAPASDPRIPPPQPSGRRVVVTQPAQQTQIVVGGVAPPLDHPDHAVVKVLSTILGGGMAGRLFVELRDKSALAYTAASFYDPVHEPGALILYLGTAPDNAVKAEQALLAEVQKVRDVPVSPEELARAKGYLLGRYAMDRRTNERLAWYLAFYEVEGVGRAYPERYRRQVEAVTAADVQRAARTYLGMLSSVVLGPYTRRGAPPPFRRSSHAFGVLLPASPQTRIAPAKPALESARSNDGRTGSVVLAGGRHAEEAHDYNGGRAWVARDDRERVFHARWGGDRGGDRRGDRGGDGQGRRQGRAHRNGCRRGGGSDLRGGEEVTAAARGPNPGLARYPPSLRRTRASSAARISSANSPTCSGHGGLFSSTYWQSVWLHCTK
jgi:hypothetical protein